MIELPEPITKALPGIVGSLVSVSFLKGTLMRKVAMFASGSAMAAFGTPWAAKFSDLPEGFAGFLLGLFGMTIVSKCFEAWETLDLSTMLRDWLRKLLSLPPKES